MCTECGFLASLSGVTGPYKGSVQVSCSNIVLDDIGTSQSHYEMLTNLDLYSALTLNIPSYLKILT